MEARNSALQNAQSERNVVALLRSPKRTQFRKGAAYWPPRATGLSERGSYEKPRQAPTHSRARALNSELVKLELFATPGCHGPGPQDSVSIGDLGNRAHD